MFVPVPYRWLSIVIFVTALVVVSVTPARSQPGDSVFEWLVVATPMPLQKLLHVALYALLAFLLAWAMENVESRLLKHAAAFTLTVSLGATLEGLQTRIPGRFGTLTDALLNAGGAVLGVLLAVLLF